MTVRGSKSVARAAALMAGIVLFSAPSISAGATAGDAAQPLTPVSASALTLAHGLGNRPTTVIVELDGAPVSVADAATGNVMSPAGKEQLKSALQRQQAVMAAKVATVGGTVRTRYQVVYNGMAVTIPADRVAALAALSGVKAVYAVRKFEPDNTRGVPFVGAPQAWSGVAGSTPVHGEGIKIGIIDTGIDYTHADFGGPGTPAAYQAALATDAAAPDPSLFGPGAPRVKGGTDLVGDVYTGANTPTPDANPLDCYGHGTHVAGTAAGSGVLSDGSTYAGAYDSSTIASHTWNVGPGAAPQADIYSIRVFGCAGSTSTDVIISGLEWAAANDMNVVNLSLGSSYGSAHGPEADAIDNLTNAGTIVVASAGNAGPNPYIVGAPSSANGALSVAATEVEKYASIALNTGATVTAIEANDIVPANLSSLPVVVLSNGAGGIALGCNASDYPPSVIGALVVTMRGTCARVDRAIYAQQAGAAAVVMVNNLAGYPPYEGEITTNPDTSAHYHVTIPFLGAQTADGPTFLAAAAASAVATVTDASATDTAATFSSGGPRSGDSALKPDVAAPGVNVFSAGMGTGTAAVNFSGTSMASPLTAGVAALVREAHPTWRGTRFWKAAIVNTASADLVNSYQTRSVGAGAVQAPQAVLTDVVALGSHLTATLSYGFLDFPVDYHATRNVTLRNFSASPVTFTIATAHDAGSPHSIVTQPNVTVPALGIAKVAVELDVPAATAGDSSTFHDVSGLVTFTPQSGTNHDVALSVPYYFVPQAASRVRTLVDMNQLESTGTASATTTNVAGAISGHADWYAWGLTSPKSAGIAPEADIRAVGAQESASTISFAISTYGRWSNPAADFFEINVDVDGDGVPDYLVESADHGALLGGAYDGTADTAVISLVTGRGFLAGATEAPFNSDSLVMRVSRSLFCQTSSPCLASQSGRIDYAVQSSALDGSTDNVGTAFFNTVNPALSVGMLDTIAPGARVPETVTYDATEAASTPALGFMIVTHDNRSFNGLEAQLLALP